MTAVPVATSGGYHFYYEAAIHNLWACTLLHPQRDACCIERAHFASVHRPLICLAGRILKCLRADSVRLAVVHQCWRSWQTKSRKLQILTIASESPYNVPKHTSNYWLKERCGLQVFSTVMGKQLCFSIYCCRSGVVFRKHIGSTINRKTSHIP